MSPSHTWLMPLGGLACKSRLGRSPGAAGSAWSAGETIAAESLANRSVSAAGTHDGDHRTLLGRPVPQRSAWLRTTACVPRKPAAPGVAAGHLLAPRGWRRLGRVRSSQPD